jgi:hypothetical protein
MVELIDQIIYFSSNKQLFVFFAKDKYLVEELNLKILLRLNHKIQKLIRGMKHTA